MSIDVKICGLKDRAALEAALEGGAAYVGLVFFPPSPRFVSPQIAKDLARHAQGRTRVTGLFVNPTDDELRKILDTVPLDLLQLHGTETPERVKAVKKNTGLRVMKALGIATEEDFAPLAAYEETADLLLFDAKPAPTAQHPGGNAHPFNWSLLKNRPIARPWLLAGGLTPDNLTDALHASGAHGVDVSSGVENSVGQKSPEKIRHFLERAKDRGL